MAVLRVVDQPGLAASITEFPPPPRLGEGDASSAYDSGESSLVGYDQPDGTQLIGAGDSANFWVTDRLPPVLGGWRRIDGPQPSDVCQPMPGGLDCGDYNTAGFHRSRPPSRLLHVDVHALAFGGGLVVRLRPNPRSLVSASLAACSGPLGVGHGVILQSDDGGLATSTDCGATWHPALGLSNNPAALMAGYSPRPGAPPKLYVGGRDNDTWTSDNGGRTWYRPSSTPGLDPDPFGCGDCDGFYVDQLGNLVAHAARDKTHRALQSLVE
jgi:hypothetical protein